MSVRLEKCSSAFCGRPYEVEHFSKCFSQGMPSGMIECPHCGQVTAANPALVYISRPLPEAMERWPEKDFTPESSSMAAPKRTEQKSLAAIHG
jgi:hypothetical protein